MLHRLTNILLILAISNFFLTPVPLTCEEASEAALPESAYLRLTDLKSAYNLAEGWRYHNGDDANFSRSDFDDSAWPVIDKAQRFIPFNAQKSRFIWLRKTLYLDQSLAGEPLAINASRLPDACEIYLNGHLIGRAGSMPPQNYAAAYYPQYFFVSPSLLEYGAENKLALRFYAQVPRLNLVPIYIANPALSHSRYVLDGIITQNLVLVTGVIVLLMFLLLLVNYVFNRHEKYYLFFLISQLAYGTFALIFVLELPFLSFSLQFLLFDTASHISVLFFMLFMQSFYKIHHRPQVRNAILVITGCLLLIPFFFAGEKTFPLVRLCSTVLFITIIFPSFLYTLMLALYITAKQKTSESRVMTAAVLFLFLSCTHDVICRIFHIVPLIWVSPLGVLGTNLALVMIVLTRYISHKKVAEIKTTLYKILEDKVSAQNLEIQEVITKLHASEKKYREFFEDNLSGDFIIDPSGAIIDCNPVFLRMFGFAQKTDALGRNIFDFFPYPEDREYYLQNIHEQKKVMSTESRRRRPDGQIIDVVEKVVGVFQGNRLVALKGYLYDITERKVMEQQMIRAKEVAEKASLIKDQFLSNMSHEIRTPLTSILGTMELLRYTGLTAEQSEYLNMMKFSGNMLLKIVNDILDLIKIESGKRSLSMTDFDVCQMVKEVVASFQLQAEDKKLALTCRIEPDVPVTVHGEEQAVAQILVNLISNAIKFTPAGRVTVSLRNKSGEEGLNNPIYLEFTVADTGIGIPEERREEIFDRFLQLENPYTKKYSGTGLGLAIVKHLVEMLGGKIEVESKVGEGSTFRLSLPFKPGHAEVTQSEESAASHTDEQIHYALLAEDNPMTMTIIKKMLNYHFQHLVLDEAENGEQVLEKIKEKKYNLILMDIQMPVMNGFECAEKIREIEMNSARRTPIIALSAFTIPNEVIARARVCLDDFIIKPINEHHLVKKVKQILYSN